MGWVAGPFQGREKSLQEISPSPFASFAVEKFLEYCPCGLGAQKKRRGEPTRFDWDRFRREERKKLDQAGFLQSREGAVFVDRFEGFAGGLDLDVAPEFGDEHALGLEIGSHRTFDGFRHVATDAAFFLGETGTMDFAAHADTGTSDTTNA
jgi:hypothetical protein